MKKAISIFTALTTILWLSGVAMIFPVHAVDFADGDLARESDEFDVYIVKLVGDKKFKRLILNPDVFNMYGHLNWADIQVVADGDLADYIVSELIRADGDEKVYKLFPDGDVGTKKWIDSLDCFITQAYDWDSVYVINTFDRDSYTTAATTMCEEEPPVGDLTFSLGANTPSIDSLPYNAMSVPYLDIKVAGSGTISQIVLKRTGIGESADFANVYLYEGASRLTSGRSISSSTSKVTFIGLSITAPTTITLVGDMAGNSSDNGHLNSFSLLSASDVTSDATVGGTFPIAGSLMTITSVQGGMLTIVDNGSIGNPNVGAQNTQLTQIRITASYEPILIERITFYNGGTMNSTEITNVELKDTTGDVKATLAAFGSDDLGALVFDTPYQMDKGENEIFKLYGDIAGDLDDTIRLYNEVSADVRGVGDTYGQGVEVDIAGYDGGSGDYIELTLQGGEVTIAYNGPIAADVGDATQDTVMFDFSLTAVSNLEIRKLQLYLCFYDEGSAEDFTASTEALGAEDIKLRDKDAGTILMGPTDGSGLTVEGATNVCEGTQGDGMYTEWTDIWDLDAGETKNLQITMDIKASTDSVTDADDQWKVVLRGFTNLTNPIKYRGTNNYVAAVDIVPSSDIVGNLMTIKVSSLDVGLGALPTGSVDAVKGETGVTIMSLIWTAGDASDMNMTDLVLSAWLDDDGGTYTEGVDNSIYAKNVISNVTLYESDGTTKISGGGPKGFSGGTDDSNVTFDDLSWTIPAGESKRMIVKVDVSTTAMANSNEDYIYFDLDETADVTALDSEGNSRNSISADLQTTSSPSVYITKYDGGTLAVVVAPDGVRQENTYIYQGQMGAEMSKFKFTSTREAFLIDKVRINMENAISTTELKYISKIELEYPIDANGTLVSPRPSGEFGSVASINFSLSGREMYVPKDDYAYMTVYADLTVYTDAGDTAANNFSLWLEAGADTADFHAIGVGSSDVYDGSEIAAGDVDPVEHMYIKRAFPSFTLDQSTGGTVTSMAAVTKVFEFTITNNGDYDLVFTSASGQIAFDVLGSGEDTIDAIFSLYKGDGTLIEDEAVSNNGSATGASISFDFDDQLTTLTIPEGGSQAFYVKIKSGATQWDETGDYMQLELDNIADVVQWKDGADNTVSGYILGLKDIGIPLEGPVWNVNTN